MDDIKIRFSLSDSSNRFSFNDIADIGNHQIAQAIKEKVSIWEQHLKEAAIGHLLSDEIGQEQAKQFKVDFKLIKKSQPVIG